MKFIHTSDWHIGRSLYGRKRYEEYEAFLNWLADYITREQVEALLIAGDIFDNTAPSNRAQEIYYRFLCRIAASPCRDVVITAGNHDSPSFLNAPRELLRFLNIHVIGSVSGRAGDEVLVLRNDQDEPEMIVCAVPYLRDRDMRRAEAGESREDKERKLVEGIGEHYRQTVEAAERIRADLGKPLPLVAMGHLFTAGGQILDGDGVRNLYVGSLAPVGAQMFPAAIDYLALGHLHQAQRVGGAEHRRYSGSPLAMGFGEAGRSKSVYLVEVSNGQPVVTEIPVPCFQLLEVVQGDWAAISGRLEELKARDKSIWLEIIYDGDEIIGDLRQRLDAIIAGSKLEVLRAKNKRMADKILSRAQGEENLDDLDVNEVFQRCLEAHQVPPAQVGELLMTYNEALQSLYEGEQQAE